MLNIHKLLIIILITNLTVIINFLFKNYTISFFRVTIINFIQEFVLFSVNPSMQHYVILENLHCLMFRYVKRLVHILNLFKI